MTSPNPRRWLAFSVILSGTLLGVLDFLIVNIALPHIRADLGAGEGQIQLTVAGYGLAFAVFLITGGRLGDLYGRKRIFQVGMAGFTFASTLCGFAQSPLQLVVFRVFQGFWAALMSPQVLATIQVTFEGTERDKATGILGAVVGVGSFAGNVFGGWLVDANLFGLGWRPIFFVNVPIGILALVLTQIWVQESKAPVAKKLDIGGAILAGAGLFCLIFPLSEGREWGWPAWMFGLMALAPVLGWIFVVYERQLAQNGGAPLVDLALFQSPGFGRGLTGILLLFSGISSFALTLTLFLQDGLRVSAQHTGWIFGALSVSFLIASLNAARLLARFGTKVLLWGLALMQGGQVALILLMLVTRGHFNPYFLTPFLFFYGLGQGLCVPQLIRQSLNGVAHQNAGAAAGIVNTTQQIAFSTGVSVVGGLFFAVRGAEHSPDAYARALAAAFTCNFVFVFITRLLVANTLRRQNIAAAQPLPVVVEV